MTSKRKSSAEEDARLMRAYGIAADGHTLLKAGMSPTELKARWIETGFPEETAAAMVELAQHVGPIQRRSRRRFYLKLIAVPLLIVAAVFAIVKVVQAVQGPNPYTVATDVTEAACGDTRNTRVIDLAGDSLLTQGEGLRGQQLQSFRSSDDFGDLVLDGDQVRASHVLCTDLSSGESITCAGYYSPEVIDAIETSSSLDEARQKLLRTASDADYFSFSSELMSGGRTVTVEGARIDARLVFIADGTVIAETTRVLEPECPETHYGSSWEFSATERQSSTEADLVEIVRDLTGVDISR